MTPNEPDAEVWRRLLVSLTGNSAVDAAVVREFCNTNGVTSAQFMTKIHTHRRINQQKVGPCGVGLGQAGRATTPLASHHARNRSKSER
jgi:hypothetical protein